jgi:hypothetical protein
MDTHKKKKKKKKKQRTANMCTGFKFIGSSSDRFQGRSQFTPFRPNYIFTFLLNLLMDIFWLTNQVILWGERGHILHQIHGHAPIIFTLGMM